MKDLKFILGPCACESVTQMEEVIRTISVPNVPANTLIRASLYKPRSSYGTFEGLQSEGASMLNTLLGEEKISQIATEIFDAKSLQICVAYGIKNFWIGARTTTNPFSVREIASELALLDKNKIKSIGIKNPTSRDLALWYGAYQRICQSGHKPYLIFRGITTGNSAPFRNEADWDFVFQMKEKINDQSVQFILDPSHIAGDRKYVLPLTIEGLRTGLFDGIMVETHPNPEIALSDAGQQLYLDKLPEFVKTVNKHWLEIQRNSSNCNFDTERQTIVELDNKFYESLQKYLDTRRILTDKIGKIKATHSKPVYDAKRYHALQDRIKEQFKDEPSIIPIALGLFNLVHNDSVNRQIQQNHQDND